MTPQFVFEEPRTRVGRWLSKSGADLAPEIRRRLFATTYAELAPVLVGGSNALAISITAGIRLENPALLCVATVDALLLCLRVALVLRGRRPGMAPDLMIFCGILWCVLQVVTVAIVLPAGDTFMSVLLLASSLGTIGGIVARNFPAPRYALTQILILFAGYEVCLAIQVPQFIPLLALQCVILTLSNAALLRTMRRNALSAIEREIDSRTQAISDPLTRLLNRRGLEEAYEARRPKGEALALFCLDLDGFKSVNDRLGHAAGDAVLKEVASRLAQVVPSAGAIGRIGGDEFVVLAPVAGEGGTRDLGARLVLALSHPFVLEGGAIARVGASAGGVVLSGEPESLHIVMRQADALLYQAKREGKGRCFVMCVATSDASKDAHDQQSLGSRSGRS